jgi:FkbM family methyltransferase
VTSYYDLENCYKFILGRPINADEQKAIASNLLQLTDIPLQEHRRRFLSSAEFHHHHGDLLFNNFVPGSIVVLFETKYGFRLYLDLRQYHISFGIMSGEYEKFDVDLVKAMMPDDGHFIDIGGNVGYYSLAVAARKDFRGKVLTIEPLPMHFDLLQRSIQENGLGERVSAKQLALADRAGEMPLNDAEVTINAGATRLMPDAGNRNAARMVQVETLDRIIGDLKPDVMKVDIQGAEGLFVTGAQRTIIKHRPSMLMEINSEMLALLSKISPGTLHRQLSALGYGIWNSSGGKLSKIATAVELDIDFPIGKVANILMVHADRQNEVAQRLAAIDISLESVSIEPLPTALEHGKSRTKEAIV